ncbi:MAG: hypothetical protein U0K31_04240 [Blautia sp.]|nr:hypothetical protein [Blautia sp.]
MVNIETKKYYVRKTTEQDFEEIKLLLKENEYLSLLWSVPVLDEGRINDLVESLYIKSPHNYGIIDKETERLCGHLSFIQDDREGELSVRMKESADMCAVMEIFGKILNEIRTNGQKNLTIQYSFD